MHEKGGLELALKMDSSYSVKQLYKILELLDVHDALQKEAFEKDKATKKTKGK